MKSILVTGSREFTDRKIIDAALDLHEPDIVIHGGCRGADTIASQWCSNHQHIYEILVPAKWHILGKSAGMERNRAMLTLAPSMVLAFFKTGAENRGTTGMTKIAQQAGIHVEAFWA